MKNNLFYRHWTGIVCLMCALVFNVNVWATDFSVDGIYYSTLTSNTVQVVKPTSGKYTGDITIPATVYDGQTYQVVAIGDYAFQGANQVTSVTLPLVGITSIGGWAFNDCTGLTSFMLPASVTSIGEKAFYFCDNLHDLYVCATDPASYNPGNMAFSKIHYGSHKCTLHVPTGCTAAYAADPTFSVFTQVEEFDPPVLYDIYVAGTRVTEYNASDILGDWGTVSYNAETKTLTLDGANIYASGETDKENSGIYVGEEDVTIVVAGSSSINANNDNEGIYFTKDATITGAGQLTIEANMLGSAIKMFGNSLTIDGANLVLSANDGSGIRGSGNAPEYRANTLTIKSSTITASVDPLSTRSALGGIWEDVQLIDCYIELPEEGRYDWYDGVVDKNGDLAKEVRIKPGVAPVLYDIYVKGIHVSDQNASDILGNGTVSYSAGTKTLTLNGAYIEASGSTDLEKTGIYIGEEDVTILVIGESTINLCKYGIHFTKDATITGSEQLSIGNISDNAIRMSENSLTIDGANLTLASNNETLKGINANTLTIKSSTITASSESHLCSAIGGIWQDVQLIDCFIELPEGGEYSLLEEGVVDNNGDLAQEVRIKPGVAPVYYDIYIAGTRVTEDNASDILGNGTVSYNAETKILTLDGANIEADGATDMEKTGIYVGEEDVIILVIGASYINADNEGIYLTKDATITGSEELPIDANVGSAIYMKNNSLTINGANLVLSSLYGSGISGSGANELLIMNSTITATADPDYSAPALGGGWKDVQLIDCYIELPEEGKYDPEKGVVDKNDVPAQDASIKPGVAPVYYDIYVKGIHVSDQNASDILENGTVSYNAETKILTLDGADIDAYGGSDIEKTGIYVGEEDVIIGVVGESTITSNYEGIYLTKGATIMGSEQLTIDANVGSAIYMKNNYLNINGANLVLSSLYGSGISGSGAYDLLIMNSTITATADPDYSAPALDGGWKDVQLIDCYIELPEGGKYDPEKGVVDKNGDPAQEVRIKLSSYTITWKNDDGSTIDQTVVEYGQTPTHADPSKPATAEFTYTFAGWTPAIVAVTGDATYTATYNSTINTYTVTFVDYNDAVLKSETVEYGKAAIAPADPKREGYTFKGWDKKFDKVTSDLTVKAQYTINVYTVTFVDKDGKTIKSEDVEWGHAATAPDAPAVEGYHFTGWDKKFDKVTSDLTVKTLYAINVYTVTFADKEGKTIKSEDVEWGHAATAPDAPAVEGYHFTGWDKKFDNVTSNLTVTAQYTINVYTVTFVDKDGKTIKSEDVEWGHAATAPDAPAVTGYHFTGWDKAFDNVTSDLTVKALYAINVYTVTFADKDGNTIKTEDVEHGKSATAPDAPVVEGYTFTGWDKDFSNITSDLTVKAQYTINVYTVTFVDKDGKTIKTEKVEYGKAATAPDAPVVTGWTFAGWDKAFNVVKSDLTVQATYTKNPVYTVTFKDYDGSTIAEIKVEEGKSAVKPDDPIREGYTFTGWDKDFSNVTSDLTITAQYTINVYTVTFVDKDEKTLKTEEVEHGKSATAPDAPAVTGYHFTGWDKAFDKVTSDLTITAQYTINVYTVTFVDKDEKTLKTEEVEHGKSATAPDAPVVEGYTFTGWDKKFDKVTSDLTVKALYAINVYTVTFEDKDGKTIKVEKVEYGKSATAPDAPVVEGYTFMGWDKKFDKVTSDLTVKTLYAINVYTVTFEDKDGKTIKTEDVEHGKAATAPDAPAVEGYTFKGWDKAFDKVTSDLTVKAQYTINVYTVTFVDKDGKTIKTEKVEYGKAATAPDAPVVTGWTFAGWDKAFNVVKSDLTVQATYTKNPVYTVTFKDYDGSTIAEIKVEEGKSAVKPDDPIREGYTFTGWDKDFSNVTSDLTITAQYTINVYTVTFLDKDNKTIKTEKVEYGKAATAPEAPAVEGYHFTGWDKKFNNITSDLTVKALYAINVYTVTFVDKDGNTLKTVQVEHGKSATAPDAPVVEGWTFAGWDKAFNVVKSDLTVQATYTKNPVYTVTFKDYDGSTIAEVKVEEGKSAVKPDDPIREGYTFIGWDKDFSNVTSDMTVTALYEALSDFVPQNLTVELVGVGESDTQITLSWDKVEGAFSYDLRLAIGEKELFTRNTMTLTSLTALLSQIEEQYHLTPGTYLIDWFVRSTDKDGEAISEWAQGESFEVTIKEPQGIEDVNANANANARKEMRNGLLYIIRNGRTYDANGKLVQ